MIYVISKLLINFNLECSWEITIYIDKYNIINNNVKCSNKYIYNEVYIT